MTQNLLPVPSPLAPALPSHLTSISDNRLAVSWPLCDSVPLLTVQPLPGAPFPNLLPQQTFRASRVLPGVSPIPLDLYFGPSF